jgi:hypothetical protein
MRFKCAFALDPTEAFGVNESVRLIGGFVTGVQELISDLRQAEQQLVRQLEGVRGAISSLEIDGAASPAIRRGLRRPATSVAAKPTRKRGSWSPAARRAVSLRMKKYWAGQRRAKAA